MPRRAFTLVELLVVIAIIGLLSTVAVVGTSAAGMKARNQKRKTDLTVLAKALDMYYNDNGRYPVTTGWWGNCNGGGYYTPKADSGADTWIPGLTPDYIGTLPRDPMWSLNSARCYAYRSYTGTDYKILSSTEGTWTSSDPFYDVVRPTWAWQVTNNLAVTNTW